MVAGARVTDIVYVCVVCPSSAVTVLDTVVTPTSRVTVREAPVVLPAASVMMTVAAAWVWCCDHCRGGDGVVNGGRVRRHIVGEHTNIDARQCQRVQGGVVG